jgi:hypothetical protein
MQIHSNLNSMILLEKKLEKSAAALAKLNLNNEESSTRQETNIKQQYQSHTSDKSQDDKDLKDEIINQTEMPLVYSVNATGVSVQNSIHLTTLDIKV